MLLGGPGPRRPGARQVLVLPFILNAAGHVKMELPHALAAKPASAIPASNSPSPVTSAWARHLCRAAGPAGTADEAAGHARPANHRRHPARPWSSDAGANGELAKMARWIFEANDHELVDLAFTGVTWPRLETAVQRQVRLGAMQIAIVPVYLFTGVLIERIQEQVTRLKQQQYPQVAFALGTHFGFDPGIFALLDARWSATPFPRGACSNATAANTAPRRKKNICTTTAIPPSQQARPAAAAIGTA